MKTTAAAFACLCALSIAMFASAAAQTNDAALRGIVKVNLIIEDVPASAEQCGITKEKLRSAFMAHAVTAPFSVLQQEDPTAATIYLKAAVMALEIKNGPCVTEINLRVYDYEKVHIQASNRDVTATVELWEKATMLATARESHEAAVSEAVAQKLRELGVAWTKDNQR